MPCPETEQVIYYIEAEGPGFNPAQSGENVADVMDSSECQTRDPSAAYFTGGDPGIIVGDTVAGPAATPPGFKAAGIAGFMSVDGAVTTADAADASDSCEPPAGLLWGLSAGTILLLSGNIVAGTWIALKVTGEDECSPCR